MRQHVGWILACSVALVGCDDGGNSGADSTTGTGSSTADDVQTTIPVTSVTDSSTTTGSNGSTDTSSGTDTDTGMGSSGSGGSTGSSTTDASSSTGHDDTTGTAQAWDVEWCNLQFPATITGGTETMTTVYSRIYVEGLTDQSPSNDQDPLLEVEFGYGGDGSDPADGDWTWVAGTPNAGWNGATAGQPNNDEYQGDLQFPAAGTYDYAARVSGDDGKTWVYCDLDGLVEGGYSADQAGDATIE